MRDKLFDAIVVLNGSYPFARVSPFLDNELPYMKRYTKKILFVPLGAKSYGNVTINDASISVIKGLREPWATRWVTDASAMFKKSFWTEYKKCRRASNDLFSFIKTLDYSAQLRRFERKLQYVLAEHIAPADNVLFYAYWLDICAHLAGWLHEKYPRSIAISRAHGGDIFWKEHGVDYVPYRWESVQNLDAIFSVSNRGKDYLKNDFEGIKDHIFCSRLGTEDCGRNLLDAENPFTVVSCSSLISLKRVHLLIEALALCEKEIRWIHFGDGLLREKLEKQARVELHSSVDWEFRGHVSPHKLMEVYRELSIDMFINVSSTEGIPVSIMEALSFGIPVMATDVGGTKEAVIDGYNGKLLPANITPAELAQAIMNFRKELELSGDRYRNNARESWEKNYSAERNYTDFYEKVCALHEEICGKRNSGA